MDWTPQKIGYFDNNGNFIVDDFNTMKIPAAQINNLPSIAGLATTAAVNTLVTSAEDKSFIYALIF